MKRKKLFLFAYAQESEDAGDNMLMTLKICGEHRASFRSKTNADKFSVLFIGETFNEFVANQTIHKGRGCRGGDAHLLRKLRHSESGMFPQKEKGVHLMHVHRLLFSALHGVLQASREPEHRFDDVAQERRGLS